MIEGVRDALTGAGGGCPCPKLGRFSLCASKSTGFVDVVEKAQELQILSIRQDSGKSANIRERNVK
jgi:hypothetical protein